MATANPVTEEEISCPVCFETFDNKDHEPKRLTCPHSVCVTCVRRLPSSKCPVCKLNITLPINDLARDLSVLRLLESHTCFDCRKVKELNTCKRCKVRLCEFCEKRHRTPDHCKISTNIKVVEKKFKTEKIQKIMSANVVSADEAENHIEEIFQNIHKEVDDRKHQLCAIARATCQLNGETRKIQEVPELMTQASLILEATQPKKQELETMVRKTTDIVRVMNNPPETSNESEELLKSLKIDVKKLKKEINKLGSSIEIPSEIVPDIQNPVSLDTAVTIPDYKAKQRIKRVIAETSAGQTFRSIRGLAECPQSGRIFVGDLLSSILSPKQELQIHVYEDWKWVRSIPVKLDPHILLVHEGRLYVVGTSGWFGDYSISAFDSRTGNRLYEHALNTGRQYHNFFSSKLGGNIYGIDSDQSIISEWSLMGHVIRSIILTDCTVKFMHFPSIAVKSRDEFSVANDDSSVVYIFSNTGQYKRAINLPQTHCILFMTTDYQDNLLLLTRVEADDDDYDSAILVYDKDHKHVASIDLSGMGINYAAEMIVTKTGDLVATNEHELYIL